MLLQQPYKCVCSTRLGFVCCQTDTRITAVDSLGCSNMLGHVLSCSQLCYRHNYVIGSNPITLSVFYVIVRLSSRQLSLKENSPSLASFADVLCVPRSYQERGTQRTSCEGGYSPSPAKKKKFLIWIPNGQDNNSFLDCSSSYLYPIKCLIS